MPSPVARVKATGNFLAVANERGLIIIQRFYRLRSNAVARFRGRADRTFAQVTKNPIALNKPDRKFW